TAITVSTSSTSTTSVPGTSTSTSLAPGSTSSSTSSSSTTSSTSPASSTTSTTVPTTPAVCAARGGLEAIRCFCQSGETIGCGASPLPPSVDTPFRSACRLQGRATAATKPHARATLTARARSTLKTATRRAQRAGVRGTVSVECAQSFATISGG